MIRLFLRSVRPMTAPLFGALALAACAYARPNPTPVDYAGRGSLGDVTANRAGGDEGGTLFIFPKPHLSGPQARLGIATNPYLWRGALLTLGDVPLAAADPFGGVIVTDWYSLAGAPDERFKDTVLITGHELRSDAVQVRVFRQLYRGGRWIDAAVGPDVPAALQSRVLNVARSLQQAG